MSEASVETPEVEPTEVGEPEAVNEKTVPAERFNGLQRAHQQALAKLRELEASAAKPEAERQSMPEEVNTDIQSVLEGLAGEVLSLKREKWVSEAVREHPEVAPLQDFLQGSSKDDVLSLAKDISERLKAGQKPADAVAEATETQEPSAPTGPPVPAGTPSVTGPSTEDELAAARDHARRNKGEDAWSLFLKKKYEQLGIEY